jgi:arylsulfatase A-like enzyme
VDLLATVAGLLGVKLPENAGEDSYNILPALLGQNRDQPIREATVHHAASGRFAIRKGDWVLIDGPSGDDNGPRGEPAWFKKKRSYQPHALPGELYNLGQDLAQRRNLYAEHPDKVRELKGLLEKYQRAGRSTPGVPSK